MKTERFARDPGWSGERNRLATEPRAKRQDFGWRRSTYASRRRGEIGGVVWRSVAPAYYGKPVGPFSFDTPVSASGTLALRRVTTTSGYQNGSTLFIGFFNHREQGWRPIDFLGFRLEGHNDPDRPGPIKQDAILEISYGTRAYTAGGDFLYRGGTAADTLVRDLDESRLLRVPPDGSRHPFSIRYDPRAGHGEITLEIDGTTAVLRLGEAHRKQGATFDRFGLFNCQLDGNEMEAYLGDVTINGEAQDLSGDPHWDAEGNRARLADRWRYGRNDFGYERPPRSGGSGKIGGRFWRVEADEAEYHGWYGDDAGALSLNERLFASGRIYFPRFSVDSGMHFGWFNHERQGWPPANFVGVYVDSLTSVGRIFTPMYGTRRAALKERRSHEMIGAGHSSDYLQFVPDGRPHRWTLLYEPEANGGAGAITLTLDDRKTTLNLAPGARAEGARIDRFGMFNMQDNNGKDCLVFLDDLTYTTGK
jgi:hypothetical protein